MQEGLIVAEEGANFFLPLLPDVRFFDHKMEGVVDVGGVCR